MIQFNLLPDVKIAYVKAQRTKRMVIGSALIATASTFAIFLLLFLTVHVVQKKSIDDLNDDIKSYSSELKSTPDLNKILTIQNQLGSLPALHDDKVISSRVLTLIQQVTPSDVTISNLSTDFSLHTMTIIGQAAALDRVNVFTDTLKFATYDSKDDPHKTAFSDVVLSQFSRSPTDTSYTITLSYQPELFANEELPNLTVPKTVTTRSVVEQPLDIFKKSTTETNTQGN